MTASVTVVRLLFTSKTCEGTPCKGSYTKHCLVNNEEEGDGDSRKRILSPRKDGEFPFVEMKAELFQESDEEMVLEDLALPNGEGNDGSGNA